MKKTSSKKIKDTLDKWVSKVGTGRYQPRNYVDDIDNTFSLSENFWYFNKLRLKFINS